MRTRNFQLVKGSTFTDTWVAKNDDGTTMDLTGFTGYGQIRPHGLSETTFDITVSIIGDPTLGQVKLTVLPSVSNTITGSYTDTYVYDVTVADVGGDDIRTLFRGNVEVLLNRTVTS